MALDSLLFLAVVFSFICSGALQQKLLRVECQPAVGVVGETVKISCSFKSSEDLKINIDIVSVFKSDPENPVFLFKHNIVSGDSRFKLSSENNPSLELTNTAITDEGKYRYQIITNRGAIEDGSFTISVTAKYNKPTINSWPEVIEDGGNADLYCHASGGYPAGAIHWFDKTGTNWTESAILEITEGENKLMKLSSKLTFKKIDSSWAPFRCVVLSRTFVKEGESDFHLKLKEGPKGASVDSLDKPTNINVVAPVVVIGSLVVGLLLVILLRGRWSRRHSPDQTYAAYEDPDVEKALSPAEPKEEAPELKTQKPDD